MKNIHTIIYITAGGRKGWMEFVGSLNSVSSYCQSKLTFKAWSWYRIFQ